MEHSLSEEKRRCLVGPERRSAPPSAYGGPSLRSGRAPRSDARGPGYRAEIGGVGGARTPFLLAEKGRILGLKHNCRHPVSVIVVHHKTHLLNSIMRKRTIC